MGNHAPGRKAKSGLIAATVLRLTGAVYARSDAVVVVPSPVLRGSRYDKLLLSRVKSPENLKNFRNPEMASRFLAFRKKGQADCDHPASNTLCFGKLQPPCGSSQTRDIPIESAEPFPVQKFMGTIPG